MRKPWIVAVVVFLAAVALAPTLIGAIQDDVLAAEIDAGVVNPCLLVQMRANEVFSKLDQGIALPLLREAYPNDIQAMRDAIRPLVEGKGASERMAIYSRARESCGAPPSSDATVVPPCNITGDVPEVLWSLLCDLATSVHGDVTPFGSMTAHALTLVIDDREFAIEFQSESPSAENLMLELLGAWMRVHGSSVAQVHVVYDLSGCAAPHDYKIDQCVYLATAMTRGHGPPFVVFH